MLPANMLGTGYLNGSSCAVARSALLSPTNSCWERSSGRPERHAFSPFLRKVTVTLALRFSSPVMRHSKPSDTNVGGSAQNSPDVVLFCSLAKAADVDAARQDATSRP